MKKIILFSASLLVAAGILFYNDMNNYGMSQSAGTPPGYTGAPGDNGTCNTQFCHSDGPAPTNKTGWISSNVPASGYVPGHTYTITTKAVYTGRIKFGFQVTCLDASNNKAGTLAHTTSYTQDESSSGRQYETHTTAGNTSSTSGSMTWTFNWTAPASGTGTVTFYGAFNCANNNNAVTGDYIYTSTLTLQENTTGIATQHALINNVNVYPNPVANNVNISYTLNNRNTVDISLYSVDGRKVAVLDHEVSAPGKYNKTYDLKGKYASGIYFIKVKANDQVKSNKIILE